MKRLWFIAGFALGVIVNKAVQYLQLKKKLDHRGVFTPPAVAEALLTKVEKHMVGDVEMTRTKDGHWMAFMENHIDELERGLPTPNR